MMRPLQNFYSLKSFITLLFLFLSSLPLLGQSSYTKVVAEPGDGVFTLLRRHGLNPSEHINSFLELNQENIGKDKSLFAGRTYLLPMASTGTTAKAGSSNSHSRRVIEEPLFGPKYSRVVVKDQQLSGAVYYLSAGHGGPDPGAVGNYGPYSLSEDEYAYDVSIRLARNLMEHGATVYMIIQDPDDGIRDESILKMDRDEINYPNEAIALNQTERLRQRTRAINGLYAKHKGAYQRMLAIHVDSRSKSQNIDVFFYHHQNSSLGQKMANHIHQTFTSKYRRYQPNREYSGSVSHRSNLYVIKYTHPPTVFIELGNIRNDLDQRRFVISDNRQALANWIAEGIISDYRARD
ncbi:N-acetylmuramoyl-L-alanine amidase family protein [Pontibacter harenae]|uniref:N-acetylmuramoyl-L-alanine amidase family protein n=1 Tax=Pontibacter harenae TaxID=2894083 RepID=UPI001E48C3C6|nr:N-acetylmuramoyl-L-alanine amidase [Pontibacter harenae]MCC9165611.1 N-acetylmuramoyl-L-alanine amidase [Pontibacter harenae]